MPPDGGVKVSLTAGQELRDEFTCPITRQLMRVPVIAADGHTYDRAAIERWLANHENSPKTGEALEHRLLVPNHNLKRLIDDLMAEGGRGLYSRDGEGGGDADYDAREERKTFEAMRSPRCATPTEPRARAGDAPRAVGGRRAELVREPVLLLQCLGPVESEWNGRSFEVSSAGVVGGRRRPDRPGSASASAPNADDDGARDFMPFADSTVSRRHFEIDYDADRKRFRARDLGSASGTFRRLREGEAAPLEVGSMAMIGKHQLVCVSCTAPGDATPAVGLECFAPDGSPLQGSVFKIGPKGASLGRRPGNGVTFSHDVDGESVGVDSSVSAEHARVECAASGAFSLRDGTPGGRASTNGTWVRLSRVHARSDAAPLETGDELLVGTIRFHATATHTVVERDLP